VACPASFWTACPPLAWFIRRHFGGLVSRHSKEPAANKKNKPTLRTLLAQWNCAALIPSGCALWFVICDKSAIPNLKSEID
jgi:hypothetical protein